MYHTLVFALVEPEEHQTAAMLDADRNYQRRDPTMIGDQKVVFVSTLGMQVPKRSETRLKNMLMTVCCSGADISWKSKTTVTIATQTDPCARLFIHGNNDGLIINICVLVIKTGEDFWYQEKFTGLFQTNF